MLEKKYFWLKLKENFFTSKEIKKLRKIAGGDTYTIIFLKLQLLSLKNDCFIKFDNTEKDIFEQLELEIDEDINNIKMTLSFLEANNLIEIQQNDVLMLSTLENVGKETEHALKKREYRQKINEEKKTLLGQCPTEKEKEKEKEIEIDIEKNRENIIKEKTNKLEEFRQWNWFDDIDFKNWLTKKKEELDLNIKEKFNSNLVDEVKERLILYCESNSKKYSNYKSAFKNFIKSKLEEIKRGK